MGIYKANDIRGIYPEDLSPETCYRIGFYLPEILGCKRILVGRDTRTSSVDVFQKLSAGILDAGADVVDIGICDTPAVCFATVQYGFCGSVMITASHNPARYNGLKISLGNAVPVGYGTGLEKLQVLSLQPPLPEEVRGEIDSLSIRDAYADHVQMFAGDLSGLRIVIDASNGGAAIYLETVFSGLHLRYSAMNAVPDGTFPGHGPNPLERDSWKGISQKVLDEKAHAGVLFDGDGDRAVFFDENGEFISPDIITALIGGELLSPGAERMFYDIRSSKSVAEYVHRIGGHPAPCGSGHARIRKLLRDSGGEYAGELSGHYYFRKNHYCDSGFIAALVVLTVLKKLNRPFSEVVKDINPYFFSGEINFNTSNTQDVLDALEEAYHHGRITKMDGLRIDLDSWWFIVRPSSAEPVLRLVVEADSRDLLEKKVRELSRLIQDGMNRATHWQDE